MQAVVIENINDFRVKELPEPTPGVGEVVIRVAACGLCGTDLHILKGEYPSTFPLVPGHEFSGTVERIGAEVAELNVGDRVCVDPNIYCGRCSYCRVGQVHLCERLNPIGVQRDGGFAEYCAVPESQAYRFPDSVGFEEAAMIEPLSCAVHGIDQAAIKLGQTVLILGGGAMGGLLTQLARIAGAARVIVSEPVKERRKLLEQLGADVTIDPMREDVGVAVRRIAAQGADIVLEAAGLTRTAAQAFTLTRRGGTIVFFGVLAPAERIEISPYEVFSNEWTIRGSFVNPFTTARAVSLLAAGRINVKPFISHQFPLNQFDQALKKFGQPDSYKIQVLPGG
jgi:2-desacetyl-2-hydroxyethyl bacteriochlorophyllide A dehydrogenase